MTQHEQLFTAEVRRVGDVSTVVLCGELDLGTAPMLDAKIRRASRGRADARAIDVSHLTFCDLAGQRVLLRALAAGATLVGEAPPCLHRLFSVTGLAHLLPASSAPMDASGGHSADGPGEPAFSGAGA